MNTQITMNRSHTGLFSLLAACILLAVLVMPALAFQLNGQDVTAGDIGSTVEYPIILDEAPTGLAGYSITAKLSDGSLGEITAVSFPAWAGLNQHGTLPADSVLLRAVDLNRNIEAGSTNVLLATLTIRADEAGTTPIEITVNQIDDDLYNLVTPAVESGSFTVPGAVTPTPTSTIEPTPTTTQTPAPAAGFSASPASGTAPLAVQFTDLSTGDGISAWAWDFDNDGTVDSTEQNPAYTYDAAGSYSVNLIVTGTGGDGEEKKTDYITVTDTPIPTPTTTQPPAHTVPSVSAEVIGNTVVMNWDTINDADFLGYKVVVSKDNPNPAYPGDGYMHWITDRDTTTVTINEGDGYNGGDFGGSMVAGETYYFSVTAMYEPYEPVAGNVVQLTFPGSVVPTPTTTQIPAPVADFSADTTTGQAPLTVQFTELSTGTITDYAWDLDNNGIIDSTEQNPTYTYALPGTYTAILTVTGPDGSDDETKTDYITVTAAPTPTPAQPPVAGFSGTPTSGYAPLTVQFTDESSGDYTTIYWDFNNDLQPDSLESNPSHTFTQLGNYTVNMAVTGPGGLDYEIKVGYITVTEEPVPAPVAGFSATPASGDAPLSVQFTDESTGSVTSYAWDFENDGIIDSTEQNPSHTFAAPGAYSVTLTVTNAAGSDTKTEADLITVTEPAPVAQFSADPLTGTVPLTVVFTDASTSAASYAWDFENDGIVDSTEQNPEHIYPSAGTYTVNLTVANSAAAVSEVKADYITVSPAAPVAGFSANVTDGTAPLAIHFANGSTGDNITAWAWDFENDGTIDSAEQNPEHVYTLPGRYNISLTATNAGGANTAVKEQYITVTMAPPVANFTANQTSGYTPLLVEFSDASTGTVESFAWDFENDGIVESTEQNPVHTYAAAGNYTVNLTVANAGGSSESVKADYIIVKPVPAPVVEFSANLTAGYAPLAVQFTDESTGIGLISWSWDFNNDNIVDSNDQNPAHTFATPGNHTVSLAVKGSGGTTTTTKTDFIIVSAVPPAKPKAEFIGKPTSGKAPLTVKFTDKSVGKDITAWAWDFNGDGVTDSIEQNPTYTYTSAGKYPVNLTVTNAGGADTKSKANYIKVSQLEKPTADFKANKQSGNAPLTVKFTDQSKGDSITEWSWDFNNDGIIDSTQKNPTYTYANAGRYAVKLVVTNAAGSDMEVKSDFITVKGDTIPSGKKPIAVIFADKTWGTPPMTVKFADQSRNNPTSHTWFFGDGTSSTEENPTHFYADPGIYFARLYVENSAGTDQDFRFIFVLPPWLTLWSGR